MNEHMSPGPMEDRPGERPYWIPPVSQIPAGDPDANPTPSGFSPKDNPHPVPKNHVRLWSKDWELVWSSEAPDYEGQTLEQAVLAYSTVHHATEDDTRGTRQWLGQVEAVEVPGGAVGVAWHSARMDGSAPRTAVDPSDGSAPRSAGPA